MNNTSPDTNRPSKRENAMFEIYEFNAYSKTVLRTFATFEEAEAYALATNPVCYERDEDYPGCADYFVNGLVFSIGPIKA